MSFILTKCSILFLAGTVGAGQALLSTSRGGYKPQGLQTLSHYNDSGHLKPLLHYAFLEWIGSESATQSALGTLKSDLIPTSQKCVGN